ncbi:Appr-1-p processing [Penicillium cf. griseofulvum]|uniref:Appr-1-p processing n=1 Tax=Penicillium cf. griseofulvum TaxID=2972120 RepID=A0A9W9J5M7_9EURO|nr:Appr-1-p processing [Penicillium cf. griseofulvum]KAJ5422968.1 Appr-1-p processing [Penicillium cf. griseofulvum]KAJ5433816.1 Appr-1-p processing [Penicillium cf. griseofulvum]
MSDAGDDQISATDRTDSDESLILMTSPLPAINFVQETPGDLFDAPNGAALIHACNCQGVWGAGIARAFYERYPAAYKIYRNHCLLCRDHPVTDVITDVITHLRDEDPQPTLVVNRPLGTALMIPPQQSDFILHRRRHWIICLFTSEHYGSRVDSEDMIVNSTFAALQHLSEQLRSPRQQASESGNDRPQRLYSNRFCTGLFDVPWDRIRELIDTVGLRINVYHPFEASNRRARPIRMVRPIETKQD